MNNYKVYVQIDDRWAYLQSVKAESGIEAMKLVRNSKKLESLFNQDELQFVNLDYEEDNNK